MIAGFGPGKLQWKQFEDPESFHQHRFSQGEFHTLPFSILNLRHAEVVSFGFYRKTIFCQSFVSQCCEPF